MVHGLSLLLVSLLYVGLLLAVAWRGDRAGPARGPLRPLLFALTLAVYCSSWTLLGAVGVAADNLWSYLPIYLGPLLLLAFGGGLMRRMVLIGQRQRTASVADFLAARYGRARELAALVAVISVVAAIPYFALQLKAIALSVEVLTGRPSSGGLDDPALLAAALLAVFGILFGTRHVDATRHHRGFMWAIALESVVKLLALVLVALFAWQLLGGRLPAEVREAPLPELPSPFIAQTLLAFLALFCLPRQFQVLVVECQNPQDLHPARWAFGLYLVVVCLAVLPITWAGAVWVPEGVSADAWVLALPLSQGRTDLALIAFLGGVSAATGMVLVASLAIATMVSNDLAMPWLLRNADDSARFGRRILRVRRATIVGLCLAAWAYYQTVTGQEALAAHGLLAFAAVAQFAPALLGGLYWRGASRIGARWGIAVGFALYVYTLLLPAVARGLDVGAGWLEHGPFGLALLRPEALFGLSGGDPLTHGAVVSLAANALVFVLASLRYRPSLEARLAAEPFLRPDAERPEAAPDATGRATEGDVLALCARVLGEAAVRADFATYALERGRPLAETALADRHFLLFGERLLASAVGAASARALLTAALRGSGMAFGEVVALLDDAGQQRRFNRELLNTTLEHVSHGVSVVDADLRLIAWNQAYQRLFDYPDGLLHVGKPVAELIRWNALRGECGPGDVEAHVRRRLEHLRRGAAHVFERIRPSGQVLEMRGQPLPGGGYVTTYTDVSDYKRVELELRDAAQQLERRVEDRTRALSAALAETARAQGHAEQARQATTRFMTALSHDLLQPLHAARLFSAALHESEGRDEQRQISGRIDASLRAAEELLDGLLDLSRIESGQWQARPVAVALDPLLRGLLDQYEPLARARGLSLRAVPTRAWVRTDPALLRRVLQNFIANALRYTVAGGVRIGVRWHAAGWAVEVWDTGPGIAETHRELIFEEFRRIGESATAGERGLGLGLSICQRIAQSLGHPLTLRSRPGRGSVFGILLPRTAAVLPVAPAPLPEAGNGLAGLTVLCIDDDADIRDALQTLLSRWGLRVQCLGTVAEALALTGAAAPDRLVVDYHLHDALDGLALAERLRSHWGPVPTLLLTAEGGNLLRERVREAGFTLAHKPIRPAVLRAWLAAAARPAHDDAATTRPALG
ncbi:PAS domain-containing hybrid sensor histidine kinase/response regulator [Silanimonas sp.]|uniref:hybrid sensor histidine kinase/response regulator n=1 Tax=Silanimonas sp. TaxID=1929290 RepID=UPI001BB90D17|nr:PAS domain-containing hybrid sensor histidine kinase/response regulator [Silanimonas sp.]MBS3896794.1 PAS domain-containing hybrid sensor histidine kinase/response regulator [Silanimonas sp.]MBS3924156.1 PAS domain-containing hybrid sensor histidine kinase/response regulator [Xanthomonadaceae bacterium]